MALELVFIKLCDYVGTTGLELSLGRAGQAIGRH